MFFRWAVIAVLLVAPALAQDVPRPRPRPDPDSVSVPTPDPAPAAQSPAASPAPAATEVPLAPLPRTDPRRSGAPAAAAPDTPADAPAETPLPEGAVEGLPAKPPPPPRIYQSACPAVISGLVQAKALPPIEEKLCGEQSPLSVTGVMANGRLVEFSSAATLSCAMASTLPGWIAEVDNYLRAKENTGIEAVLVGTSYMCRNVNNAASGNFSFHAFANALDVTGFRLEDGRRITLPGGWTDPLLFEGRALRYAHDAACARFTTTLGPEANALHRDHLHLDMGCHGKTCTARLCE